MQSQACAEIGGSVIDGATAVTENIPVTLKIVTSDTVRAAKHSVMLNLWSTQALNSSAQKPFAHCTDHRDVEFTNKTMPEYYQSLLKTYQDRTLTLVLEPNQVYLEADTIAATICSTPPPTQGYQPDQLTSTMQMKFYNSLGSSLFKNLEAYYTTHFLKFVTHVYANHRH